MTDSLIFHGSRYSEASLMDSRKTSNDTLNSFRQQRLKYSKHPIISRLNMNSLKNKLTSFKELILSETDVKDTNLKLKDCFVRTETNLGVRLSYRLFVTTETNLGWDYPIWKRKYSRKYNE